VEASRAPPGQNQEIYDDPNVQDIKHDTKRDQFCAGDAFVSQHPSRQSTQRVYDRLSQWYDWLAASEARFGIEGLKLLSVQSAERVLEVGCGTGRNACVLAQQAGPSGMAAAVDISGGMARQTQVKLRRAGLRSRFSLVQGDAAALPYPAGCFDAAFLAFTLELFDASEIPSVLMELRRVLRPGGRVGIVALAAVEKPGLPVRLYNWFHRSFPAWVDCKPIAANDFLCQAGFRITKSQRGVLWGLPVDLVLAVL
jgi:ubiquinone/menaquinone biosynthesis C-methylase UbiE